MPDPTFQRLFDDTELLPWAPVQDVRERARRRTVRTRVASTAAVVTAFALLASGIALAGDRGPDRPPPVGREPSASASASAPAPSTSPPASSPPSGASPADGPGSGSKGDDPGLTTITDATFLQPSDVGSGYSVGDSSDGSGDWTVEFSLSVLRCGGGQAALGPSDARRDRLLVRGNPGEEVGVSQYVDRLGNGDAARYVNQIRTMVNTCEAPDGQSIRVVADDVAGQDSLVIAVDYGGGSTATHVLVRQGDLVTQLAMQERTQAQVVELARKAAQRLCAGTPVC
jgi:hypothetical protein